MKELLTSYYDRVYYKTRDWKEDRSISLEDYDTAARELEEFLSSRIP